MKVLRLKGQGEPLGLTQPVGAIGNFDGVHLGHQKVIGQAVSAARQSGGTPVVVTFDPHPSKILRPEAAPPTLQTLERRLELFDALGVGVAALVDFTPELANTSPERFVKGVLVGQLGLRRIYVGSSFRFGHDRSGDAGLLTRLGREMGFDCHPVSPLERAGGAVSSSRIRKLLSKGAVDQAAELLGRPHEVEGTVEPGKGRGSRELVPTANIATDNECLPARGVYGAETEIEGRTWAAAVFVGRRRTFGERQDVVEAHLLDYPPSPLYGAKLRLGFRFRVRGERAFAGPEELLAQIERDLSSVRSRLLPRSGP